MQNILNKTRKKKECELANNYYICRGNQLFCLLKTFSFLLRIKETSFTWSVLFLPAPGGHVTRLHPQELPQETPGPQSVGKKWVLAAWTSRSRFLSGTSYILAWFLNVFINNISILFIKSPFDKLIEIGCLSLAIQSVLLNFQVTKICLEWQWFACLSLNFPVCTLSFKFVDDAPLLCVPYTAEGCSLCEAGRIRWMILGTVTDKHPTLSCLTPDKVISNSHKQVFLKEDGRPLRGVSGAGPFRLVAPSPRSIVSCAESSMVRSRMHEEASHFLCPWAGNDSRSSALIRLGAVT